MQKDRPLRLKRIAPALTLAFLAPMLAEVLPGATRFSSIFVFPIEMAVWGGGAVMARALVRSRELGWWSLLFLGLGLSIARGIPHSADLGCADGDPAEGRNLGAGPRYQLRLFDLGIGLREHLGGASVDARRRDHVS